MNKTTLCIRLAAGLMILTTVLPTQAQDDLEARTQQASSYNDKGVAAVHHVKAARKGA